VTSVLLVSVLLGLAGLLAFRAVQRIEAATATLTLLDPGPWRQVSDHIQQATEELSLRIGDRIDG
jgi:hypothetical protein